MDKISLAARNNAHLYERVCAAHGCRTLDLGGVLLCLDPPPRFYSQAVVLEREAGAMVRDRVTGGFKDSFHEIDPGNPLYRVLFSAEWIWLEPTVGEPLGLEWRRAETDVELHAWEAGWAWGDAEAAHHPRQFPASLLECADMEFWSASLNGEVVGGVLLNLTPPVVGVSNLFPFDASADSVWHDLPNLIARQFPSQAAAGYERGDSLLLAQEAGFEPMGPLRVWTL